MFPSYRNRFIDFRRIVCQWVKEACSEPYQTFKVVFFRKRVNGFQLLTTIAKTSILDA